MGKVVRVWYGIARTEDADSYASHVQNDIFPKFSNMKGNLGAKVLRRDVEDGVEFAVITTWESLESIREFAKDDLEKAVVAEKAQPFFIKYDDRVAHFSVAGQLSRDGSI